MKLLKIGDCYLNLANITHIELENEIKGLICMVYFNCQVTDREGANGIQSCKIFHGAAARELKALLEQNAISTSMTSTVGESTVSSSKF